MKGYVIVEDKKIVFVPARKEIVMDLYKIVGYLPVYRHWIIFLLKYFECYGSFTVYLTCNFHALTVLYFSFSLPI
jgi:hypothetical protein